MKGKKEFEPQPWIFPNPTVLVGTMVNDKPNFATYAWCGITCSDPPMLSVGVRHHRYTLQGIHQNMVFSVNVPSVDLVKETDYCGIISGFRTDKVADCGFRIFYGSLKTAPLIEQCPVNLECEVVHLLNLGVHMLVIGKIVKTHVSQDCLTDGQPDIMKIRPFVYSQGESARYNAIGEIIGQAFHIGKEITTKRQ